MAPKLVVRGAGSGWGLLKLPHPTPRIPLSASEVEFTKSFLGRLTARAGRVLSGGFLSLEGLAEVPLRNGGAASSSSDRVSDGDKSADCGH